VKHIKNCNHCELLLTEDNWGTGNINKQNYICRKCDSIKAKMNRLKRLAKTIGQLAYRKYNDIKDGHVYIISNPAWEGWYKVGMAIDANDRCSGYQTSSPFRDYMIRYSKYFSKRREAERLVHETLKENNIEYKGEWFKTDLLTIQTIIKDIEGV
jgi:hypothetical protein|tara:strand:+ start:167 stop:631 length:465 start_codon:yes stop_codon:yes gene_type:complete